MDAGLGRVRPEWIEIAEAVELTGKSKGWIEKRVAAGRIKCRKTGQGFASKLVFKRNDLLAAVAGEEMSATIFAVTPMWAQIADVTRLTGVSDGKIRQLCMDGVVRGRKTGPEDRAAAVFRVQDVYDWLEETAEPWDKWMLRRACRETKTTNEATNEDEGRATA